MTVEEFVRTVSCRKSVLVPLAVTKKFGQLFFENLRGCSMT